MSELPNRSAAAAAGRALRHARAVHSSSLGGHRLIRRLGQGSRGEVVLAVTQPEALERTSVALKRFHPACDRDSIDSEVQALTRAAGDHVVALLDLALDADGRPVLVLERLPSFSAVRWLGARGRVETGEAVTLLAPVAEAVARIHAAGVAHGALGLERVLIDERGRPVLVGFGHASLHRPRSTVAELDAIPAVRHDAEALARMIDVVLEAAGLAPESSRALGLDARTASGDFARRAADALYGLAEPLPLSGAIAPTHDRGEVVPLRVVPPGPDAQSRVDGDDGPAAERSRGADRPLEEAGSDRPRPVQELAGAASSMGVPEWLVERLARYASEAIRVLMVVRRRYWIAAGASAAAVIVAAIAVQPTGATGLTAAPSTSAPLASNAPASPPTPAQSAEASNDPVEAARALLELRRECIRDLSILCLDAVNQHGSVASATDVALVRDLQSGAPGLDALSVDLDGAGATLIEQIGGTALVALASNQDAQPASLLLVKGEAGWRIREILPGA